MAKLYIKQKVFSWKDKFSVFNELGEDVYRVEGEILSIGKKLHVKDLNDREVAFIHEKVFSLLPRYFISRNGSDIAEVRKKLTFLKARYEIPDFGWTVQGNFTAHEFTVESPTGTVAAISKKWFTWGDTYEINVAHGADPVNVLCVVLIIDAVLARQAQAAASST
ncbi:MAG: LURP-one-related family protein [Clostridia bacterium]|nr:LURP-one-related family protein [Clostridia bacterium]